MVASGEGYDWYYASAEDRHNGVRSPISDGVYGKPWVFRYKDLHYWWSEPHFNRIAGVEQAVPTPWQPQSKPFWFTELGCPAVDKGANQPNVFPDSKSSENALPYFSNGRKDAAAQSRFIRAHYAHWQNQNPQSPLYAGPMVDMDNCYLWAWDARPYPAFPMRMDMWSDGNNFATGHWLNGRLGNVMLDELILHLCDEYGLDLPDTSHVHGAIDGLALSGPTQLRAVLEPLLQLFAITPREAGANLIFSNQGYAANGHQELTTFVQPQSGSALEYQRTAEISRINEAIITLSDPMADYAPTTLRAFEADGRIARQQKFALPIALGKTEAQYLVDDWLAQQQNLAQQISFSRPIGEGRLSLGDQITVPLGDALKSFEVVHLDYSHVQTVTAIAAAAEPMAKSSSSHLEHSTHMIGPSTNVIVPIIVDLPMFPNVENSYNNVLAGASMTPWRQVAFTAQYNNTQISGAIDCAATMGRLNKALEPTMITSRLSSRAMIEVELISGAFESVDSLALLNGANVLAIGSMGEGWEIVQFQNAEEIAPNIWRLETLLRGQLGTEDIAQKGHVIGTQCVLVDQCLVPLGINQDSASTSTEWLFSPIGTPFDREQRVIPPQNNWLQK